MTDRWERVSEIHGEARERPENEREAFVRAACGDDEALYHEVMSLLAVELESGELEPGRPRVEDPEPPPAGRELAGHVLVEVIGRGSTGTVFRARDVKLQRDVAVKVLEAGITTTPGQLNRFRSEPQRIARLHHPNIVGIHATGHEGPTNWFSMDLIEGHDLGKEIKLQRARSAAALLPRPGEPEHVRIVATLCADAADALQHAHAAGIVHRDIKPQNLLVDREHRELHIVDFGLARDELLGNATMTGTFAGTVHYMSPEQTTAAQASVDARTDVYSLGVVLYECLTLEQPFKGDSPAEIWHRIRTSEARPVRRLNPSIPRDLELIVRKAMQRDPEDRYRNAAALGADLRRFLRFEAIDAKPPTVWQRTRRFAVRHARGAAIGLGAILFATGGWWWSTVEARRTARDDVVTRCRATLDRFDRADLQDLLRLRRDAEILREDAAGPAVAALVREIEARVQELRREWERSAADSLARGLAEGDDALVLQARGIRGNLAILFREEPEHVAALDENPFAPRLTVRLLDDAGAAVQGDASYALLDPITGQPGEFVPLGALPVERHELPIGLVRIRVATATLGVREFTRQTRRMAPELRIQSTIRELTGTDDMVRIERGEIAYRDAAANMSGINGKVLTVRPFWIDRYEVSNADYRAFLAAHPQKRQPPHLARVVAGSPEDLLPVAFVSWVDARDYAEWVGKRLPSHAEWMLAARGEEGREFPWPDHDGSYRGNTRQSVVSTTTMTEKLDRYFERAVAVRSAPEAATATGIHHLLGNVSEWCESLAPERVGDRLVARFGTRLVAGEDWTAEPRRSTLTMIMRGGPEDSYANYNRGFRCARSAR